MARVVVGPYKGLKVPKNLEGKEREDFLVDLIISKSSVKIPKSIIEDRTKAMAEMYALRLSQSGTSIEKYYEDCNTSEAEMVSNFRKRAKRQLEGRAVLAEIARKENLHATEEEVDHQLDNISKQYLASIEEVRMVIKGEEEERLREEIAVEKAIHFVMEQAIEIE